MNHDPRALIGVLREAKSYLLRPGNDFSWSSYRGAEEAARELDELVLHIERGAVPARTLHVLFGPTGPIQEVSLSSGWGSAFLELAARFDDALASTDADAGSGVFELGARFDDVHLCADAEASLQGKGSSTPASPSSTGTPASIGTR